MMKWLSVLTALIVFAGCAGGPGDQSLSSPTVEKAVVDESSTPEKTEESTSTETPLVTAEIPKVIQPMVEQVTLLLEEHRWEEFLFYCDPDLYRQLVLETGIYTEDFLLFLLSIGMEDQLSGKNISLDSLNLNDITRVEWNHYREEDFLYILEGRLFTESGEDLSILLQLMGDQDNPIITNLL